MQRVWNPPETKKITMPTPIGQVFNDLAIKAGIAADNPALKSLLASPELVNIQVPDDIVSGIDTGLLSLDAAKNNHPDIKKKYFADAYDGMDKQLLALIANDTFDQADIDEIKAEKSTSKKAELIVSKLKAAKASAKGADKEAINEQLKIAHQAAKDAKDEVTKVRGEYEGKIANIQLSAAKKAIYANYKTTFDELPGAAREAAMDALINKALQDKNAELKVDENGNLQLVGKDGSNVFGDNHTQLTPTSLFDKTLAPILKVVNTQKDQQQQQRQQQSTVKVDEKAEANFDFVKSRNDQVLADMSAAPAAMI